MGLGLEGGAEDNAEAEWLLDHAMLRSYGAGVRYVAAWLNRMQTRALH